MFSNLNSCKQVWSLWWKCAKKWTAGIKKGNPPDFSSCAGTPLASVKEKKEGGKITTNGQGRTKKDREEEFHPFKTKGETSAFCLCPPFPSSETSGSRTNRSHSCGSDLGALTKPGKEHPLSTFPCCSALSHSFITYGQEVRPSSAIPYNPLLPTLLSQMGKRKFLQISSKNTTNSCPPFHFKEVSI